jgi:two-component system response regulator LytT
MRQLLPTILKKQLLTVEPGVEILAKIDSIRDSVTWLTNNTADLIFLDIHLSDGLSFSIFEQIEVKHQLFLQLLMINTP